MGLASGLLLGPLRFVVWTAERIAEAVEEAGDDEPAVMAALARLNDDYDRGLVDDETFVRTEDELMERLEAARARRAR